MKNNNQQQPNDNSSPMSPIPALEADNDDDDPLAQMNTLYLPDLALVSNGCECISISKKTLLAHSSTLTFKQMKENVKIYPDGEVSMVNYLSDWTKAVPKLFLVHQSLADFDMTRRIQHDINNLTLNRFWKCFFLILLCGNWHLQFLLGDFYYSLTFCIDYFTKVLAKKQL